MRSNKTFWVVAVTALLILNCTEKEPAYPWITDLDTTVETNGKLVGYEFYAKW